MARLIDHEGPIHRSIIIYLRHVLPGSAIIHHSPNEGNRGGVKGARDGVHRKKMGVMPGFPDIIILVSGVFYALEVKSGKGALSTAQRSVKKTMECQGVDYAVVRSIDDTKATLIEWGIIT